MKGSIRGRRVGRPLALLALLSLVLSGVGSRPAQAAPARQGAGVEFTVDSIADDADADPGDGVCATSVGECTLRAAIEETNNLPDAGTINVPDGIYNLSLGRLEIEDDLAIIGAGQDATIVDGGGTDLVFAVLVGTVDISGMTIRNGSGEYPPGGGGIFNAGTLTLTNCTISDNIQDGNGIHSVGTLILTNCTVSGNVAPMGGGIYNESGTLTVIDSTISGNIAFDGGGIYNDSGGTLTLDNSTISGNRATPYSGGGIENSGTLTVANSTISGNTADLGGGGISNSGVLTITNSTINGNTSYDYSGGIHNEAGLMMLTNSTISGNTSYGFGGGICNWGTLDVTNSTISSNTVASEGSARGGGIYNGASATATLKNTVVADNFLDDGSSENCSGTIASDGNNLDSDNTCNLTQSTDLPNTAPLLGPLGDNGGPTFTHALLAGSPAIDAGDDTACPDTDQRGQPRPVDGDEDGSATCDMGAFEYVGPPIVVNSIADDADADPGDGVCATSAGECTLRAAIEEANATPGLDTINFEIPGEGPYTIQPATALPFIYHPVVLDGTTQPGFSGAPIIELDGSLIPKPDPEFGPVGLHILGGESTVRGLVINDFTYGIWLEGGGNNTIQGNYIGTDLSGSTAQGNQEIGIVVRYSANDLIGGSTPAARNVISGNSVHAILVADGASGTVIQGNYIGTNADGTATVPNGPMGIMVYILGGPEMGEDDGPLPTGVLIGGPNPGEGNLISGNVGDGIFDAGQGTTIQGNLIGTDVTGTQALPNGVGVTVGYASNALIGGTDPGAGNVIAGNTGHGIGVGWSEAVTIQGNLIGTDAAGTAGIPNQYGIVILDETSDVLIGGDAPGAGNVIAYNTDGGIIVDYYYNGALPSPPTPASGITISRNAIYDNGNIGIDLDANPDPNPQPNTVSTDGVTPNDAGDGDTGPNNLQNYPVLIAAFPSGSNTIVSGTLNSVADTTFTVDFYSNATCDPSGYGEGQTYLGSATVITDGSGDVSFSETLAVDVPEGYFITATATDPGGNTSEFSACVETTLPPSAPSDLTATANGQEQIDLAWTDNASDETGFRVERSPAGQDDWQTIATPGADTEGYSDTTVACGMGYDYRVRAERDEVFSEYSNVASATTDACALTAPVLRKPADGSSTNKLKFQWYSVGGGVEYQVQVDDGADFSSPEIDATGVKTKYKPDVMPPFGDYCWRVRARDAAGNWSEWSDVWGFQYTILKKPGEDYSTTSTVLKFKWRKGKGALEYQIQVDNDADFLTPEIDDTSLKNKYQPVAPFAPGTYNWRVRVRTAGGWEGWAPGWTFTVTP